MTIAIPRVAATLAAAFVAVFGWTAPADAVLVSSLPGGTLIPQAALNYQGTGPQVFGPGNLVTWTSTYFGSVFGWTGPYSFGNNPLWNGLPPLAGVNDDGATQAMTFAFSNPQQGVGGILNWSTFSSGNATIAAYDSAHILIESFVLDIAGVNTVTPNSFHGFLELSPIISYFVLSDAFIGLRDLTVTNTAAPANGVPEPGSLSLLGLGLLGAAVIRRRKASVNR